MMSWLFVLAGLFAVLNWYAVAISNKKIEYWSKPATLITLLVAYTAQLRLPMQWWQVVFGLGLLFSLAGDVFLMLPGDQYDKGLIAFLFVHSAYIAVLNSEGLKLSVPTILMAFAIALIAAPLISSIVKAIQTRGRTRLVVPGILYGVFLSVMFWSSGATLYRSGWTRLSAGLVALGGAAFYLSDYILLWDRFMDAIRHARFLTMFTYHSAQFGLTLGILFHWGYL
jgi:uncharacterized membrane protein YhhN